MTLHAPPALTPLRWSKSLETLPVLTVRKPNAWLIVNGIKDIENRSRRTHVRGRILLHAGASRAHLNDEVFADCAPPREGAAARKL